jgi:dolichol-phosphate mannosyltransferase
MHQASSLSVVVPAYNEQANLADTIQAAAPIIQAHLASPVEWLIVDDGSTDDTRAQAQSLARQLARGVVLGHATRQGLGAAIWTGLAQASAEWCTWLPADGQIDPGTLVAMLQLVPQADLVIAIRDEKQRQLGRQILTIGMYALLRAWLGVDPFGYSGVFMVRRALIEDLALHASSGIQNYAVVMHCQRKGARVRQVRTVIRPRASGQSKVANLPTLWVTAYDIVRLGLALRSNDRQA